MKAIETPRPATPQSLLMLKSAFRRLVSLCGGPDSAQHITRLQSSALSRCGGASDANFAAMDVVLDLELDAGSPVVTAQLAAMQGYRLVLDEAALGRDGAITFAAVTEIFGHATVLAERVTDALEDGSIDPHEANQIITACEKVAGRVRTLQQRVKHAAQGVS